MANTPKNQIAIIGAGPSALFVYKHLVHNGNRNVVIHVFEARNQLGTGMPYSDIGASIEHITNVSPNEIPPLVTPIKEWLETLSADHLRKYEVDLKRFNEHKVLPRLLFGEYLSAQFDLLRARADLIGLETIVHTASTVSDIIDHPDAGQVSVSTASGETFTFDRIVICTGHNWPTTHEGRIPGYFDSPYPPVKLAQTFDHTVAIRGSSLTAVDAIRTLARTNGVFWRNADDRLEFHAARDAEAFKIVMHSRDGLLPCIRFHTESPQLSDQGLIPEADVEANMRENEGFVSLDFVFDRNFKEPLREKDPEFYERIKDMHIEEFVDSMLSLRESVEPFAFFKGEYAQAKKSIRRKESIHWKEMLSALSYAMNYPAKHMSAEDMYRHRHVLMPLIAIVIAFLPQSSCDELIALHDAGRLELLAVGGSTVEPNANGGATISYVRESGEDMSTAYETFIDCIGQRHLSLDALPFQRLVCNGTVSPARIKFRSHARAEEMMSRGNGDVERDADGDYYARVAGVAITDDFRVIGREGAENDRIYMMAVPYMGGHNPDYSGLDFCEEAGGRIAKALTSAGDEVGRSDP